MTKFRVKIVTVILALSLTGCATKRFARGAGSRNSVGPSVGAAVMFGQGQMGNDTDVLKRNMIHTPISVFGGFNIQKVRVGLNYEYELVGQSADPADFSNQNIGGKFNAPGVKLDWFDGKTSFGIVMRMGDKFTLDKPTATGSVSEYESKSAFSVQFTRQIKDKIGIVLDFSSGEMKSVASNSDDISWNRAAIGIVFSNYKGGSRSRGRSRR
jgi:hypothetical protein